VQRFFHPWAIITCSVLSMLSLLIIIPLKGWTPLMSASSAGHVVVVKILLDKGVDENKRNEGGRYKNEIQFIVHLLSTLINEIQLLCLCFMCFHLMFLFKMLGELALFAC